jgi:capsular polysaccharide biosynthesis protein
MEDEVDLRPYLLALLRRWYLIIGIMVLAALLAASLSLLVPRPNEAAANILIVPSTSQVALDDRFVTGGAPTLSNQAFQRQALLGLATSSALEQRVAKQLGGAVPSGPGQLLSLIKVSFEGDLIKIVANAQSDAEALALAESWARSYERLVAEVYSRDAAGLAMIDEQLTAAQARYSEAQSKLEEFLNRSSAVQVEQQIASIEGLLNGSSEAGTALYTRYLTRIQDLDLILSDARTLRAQVAEGGADGLGSRLSVLALRARVAGEAIPVQLQVADPDALALDDEAALGELDGLIVVIEEQRDSLGAEASRLADAIAAGDTSAGGLAAIARRRYEQELSALRGQLAQIQGQQKALEQSRDITLSSLEILQRKRDEQQIAETTPLVSVRYISASVNPATSILSRAIVQGIVGLMIGGLAGAAIALWLEIVRPRLMKLNTSASVADRPADKQVAAP